MSRVEPPDVGFAGSTLDAEVASAARARVRAKFGAALAEKASDEFCVAMAPPTGLRFLEAYETVTAAYRVGAEAAATHAVTPTVIEFRDRAADSLERSVEIRRRAALAILRDFEGVEGESAVAAKQAGPASRQLVVAALRDAFFHDAGAAHDELERTGAALVAPGRAGLEVAAQPPFTDVCWLNRSIRARTDPRSLAEVVADQNVARVDLPRRLGPDIHDTRTVVGARDWSLRAEQTGEGIIVAVIDSEVALRHPGLAGRVVHKRNFTAEAFGNPGDHGTAVAGIIASDEGIAPGATIYNYKVLTTNRFLDGEDFDGALALQRALEDGAHVANCSWGAGPAGDGSSREARACNTAWALGLAIVKSAGNNGPGRSTLTTPADAEGVIVVGATNRTGTMLEDYSSRGPTSGGLDRPHLVAPGGSDDDGMISCLVGGGYGDCGSGTSYAAPHVTGLIALLLAAKPGQDPDGLRDLLIANSTPITGVSAADQGAGLVSLAALP